ncbi:MULTISPECIES: hypothetical protein [unclassified Streptomyces]|uniref:hypothetical protein n=1 Tax=unclassified Streptomyces TaxID=2593676 RepID=UPI0022594BAC|nr:hypothetical protein [Streptomyces sp. NBC_00338]MCX5141808.1 hypothetical protein [Streptomyces sp. NBC_00338]
MEILHRFAHPARPGPAPEAAPPLSPAPAGPAPAPAEPTPEEEEQLLLLSIDLIDEQVIRLITQRAGLTARLHADRAAAGRPGARLREENESIRRYSEGFGRRGAELALLLLRLS